MTKEKTALNEKVQKESKSAKKTRTVKAKKVEVEKTTAKLAKKRSASEAFDFLFPFPDYHLKRLPLSAGGTKDPLGIFPFKDCINALYLYDDVSEEVSPAEAYKQKGQPLPKIEFLKKVYTVKDRLNACLEELGYTPLKGRYYAANEDSYRPSWVVDFDHKDGKLHVEACSEDSDVTAKCRCAIWHYEDC